MQVRGPFPASIARIETYHRWQILLQSASAEPIQQLLERVRRDHLGSLTVRTVVDVDPLNLL